MALDKHLPTLSPNGWVTNKQTILEKIYAYYLTSYFRQSNMFNRKIKSLEASIMSDADPSEIKNKITTDFTELLTSHFDPNDVKVEAVIVNNDKRESELDPKMRNIVIINLDVTINDSDTGKTYKLSKQLYTENSKLLYMETMRGRVAEYEDIDRRNF